MSKPERYKQPKPDWLEYVLAATVTALTVSALTVRSGTEAALIVILVLALVARRIGVLYQDLRKRIEEMGERGLWG